MNKPEPLKNKIVELEEGFAIHPNAVKSAVEWLKSQCGDDMEAMGIFELIDEAFEDVMKEEHKS